MAEWETKWANGVDQGEKWDAKQTEPLFQHFLNEGKFQHLLDTAKTQGYTPKALIPGCGRGYAVASLAKAGFEARGIDIAPTAVNIANEFVQHELQEDEIAKSLARVDHADFFDLGVEHEYDLVYDCTFLCALDPSERPRWAETMSKLVKPGGQLVSYVFPVFEEEADPADGVEPSEGPPFNLSPKYVQNLLPDDVFQFESMDEVEKEMYARQFQKPSKEFIGVWTRL